MKTVGDLKKAIAELDDSLPVATYVQVGEDMDAFTGVTVETRGKETMYAKGDHVFTSYKVPGDTLVVIR